MPGPCSAATVARYCASVRYANARKPTCWFGFAAAGFAAMRSRVIALHRTLAVASPSTAALARSADSAAGVAPGSEIRSAHPLRARRAAAGSAIAWVDLNMMLMVSPCRGMIERACEGERPVC